MHDIIESYGRTKIYRKKFTEKKFQNEKSWENLIELKISIPATTLFRKRKKNNRKKLEVEKLGNLFYPRYQFNVTIIAFLLEQTT